jgi:hypothetical protein
MRRHGSSTGSSEGIVLWLLWRLRLLRHSVRVGSFSARRCGTAWREGAARASRIRSRTRQRIGRRRRRRHIRFVVRVLGRLVGRSFRTQKLLPLVLASDPVKYVRLSFEDGLRCAPHILVLGLLVARLAHELDLLIGPLILGNGFHSGNVHSKLAVKA